MHLVRNLYKFYMVIKLVKAPKSDYLMGARKDDKAKA